MKKLLLGVLFASSLFAANQRTQGWCEQGGHTVTLQGSIPSVSKAQQSYPRCNVRVFLTGTVTLATLYSDTANTPLANPFTADQFGHWFFYSQAGRYDVQISGGGLAAPYTFGDIPSGPIINVLTAADCSLFSTLQQCQDSLATNGGIMYFPCGTYDLTPLQITYNITMMGAGECSVLKVPDNTVFTAAITAATANTSILLTNLTLDGNRAGNPVQRAAGVYVAGLSTRVRIDGIWLKNWNVNTVILYQDSLAGKVVNSHASNNLVHVIGASQTAFGIATQYVFTGNDFIFSSYSVSGCTNATPSICTTTLPHGFIAGQNISLAGSSVASYNNQWDITVLSPTTFSLTGSVAAGVATGGIVYEGNFSIYLYQQRFATVVANTIQGGGECIQLNSTSNDTISANSLNACRDVGISIISASTFPTSSNNTISGNTISNTFFEGLYCSGCISNAFTGNSVTGAGTSGIANRRSAVQVVGTPASTNQNSFTGGIMTANPEYGLNIRALAANTAISGVYLSGNSLGKFTLDGTDLISTYVDILGPRPMAFNCSGVLASSSTLYLTVAPAGPCTNTSEASTTWFLVTRETIVRGLLVRLGSNAVNNTVVTVRANFSNTTVTCTVLAGASTCSDITHSYHAMGNDLIDVKVVTGAGETATAMIIALDS